MPVADEGGVGEGPLGSEPLAPEKRQEFLKAMEEAQANLYKLQHPEEEDMTPKVVDRCAACGGDVVAEPRSVYRPETGPPIIGPGSRQQYSRVISYYCNDCGIMYRRPPQQMKKQSKMHPVQTGVACIPPAAPKPSQLGWTIKEYKGPEVFWSLGDLTEGRPLKELNALKVGTDCYVPSAFQAGVAWNLKVVEEVKDKKTVAVMVGSEMTVSLEFDCDDRHCWVATCFCNAKFTLT